MYERPFFLYPGSLFFFPSFKGTSPYTIIPAYYISIVVRTAYLCMFEGCYQVKNYIIDGDLFIITGTLYLSSYILERGRLGEGSRILL